MRSSSIKSLTLAATLAITLAAVPCAEAKPTRSGVRGMKAAVAQLLSRYFGIGTQEDYPSDPIPKIQSTTSSTATKEEPVAVATTPR